MSHDPLCWIQFKKSLSLGLCSDYVYSTSNGEFVTLINSKVGNTTTIIYSMGNICAQMRNIEFKKEGLEQMD